MAIKYRTFSSLFPNWKYAKIKDIDSSPQKDEQFFERLSAQARSFESSAEGQRIKKMGEKLFYSSPTIKRP